MDFSQLPYEIQFQYLSGLPYESVLNYCQSNTGTLKICQTREFWERKAIQDFGISLNLMPETTPQKQYALLSDEYQNHPGELIVPLIKSGGELSSLPDLLQRSELIKVYQRPIDGRLKVTAKPYLDNLLLVALNAGSEPVRIILDYLTATEKQYNISLKSLTQDLHL